MKLDGPKNRAESNNMRSGKLMIQRGSYTVDGRNPKQPPGMVLKPVVNNGINYLSLNWVFSPDFWLPSTVSLNMDHISWGDEDSC